MEIRRARSKDIPRLSELLLQVERVHHEGRPDLFGKARKKYTEAELERLLSDPKRPIFVAVEETVVGYAFCILQERVNDNVFNDVRTLYIDDLCVDEACRGKGVGKRLYGAVCDYARQLGCYNITLNVWCFNETAMAFYRRCGLKPRNITMETIL